MSTFKRYKSKKRDNLSNTENKGEQRTRWLTMKLKNAELNKNCQGTVSLSLQKLQGEQIQNEKRRVFCSIKRHYPSECYSYSGYLPGWLKQNFTKVEK